MNGNIRRIDFDVGLVALEHAEVSEAFAELQLNLRALSAAMVACELSANPQNVGEVELHFSAALIAGRNFVSRRHRRVQRSRRPIPGIAALRRYVAMNQADARHSGRRLVRRLRLILFWSSIGISIRLSFRLNLRGIRLRLILGRIGRRLSLRDAARE